MSEIISNKAIKDTNGFYKIETVLASAGVMAYPDGDGGQLVGFMPPEEIEKALSTFSGLPLTNDHPKSHLVTPQNYKELSVGYVDSQDLRFEKGKATGFAVVCSDEGIEAVSGGKTDVSIGYAQRKDFTPGVFVDVDNIMGEGKNKEYAYDFIKRDIKLNHLALCDEGRSVAAELILDSTDDYAYLQETVISLDSNDFKPESHNIETTKKPMTELKSIVISGNIVEVDSLSADTILNLQKEHKNNTEELDSAKGRLAALENRNKQLESDMMEYDSMKGELEALKALSTDSTVATDADVIATEASSRLAAWNLVNSLSNDSVEFTPAQTALETKRAYVAANYTVDNVNDASEAFLDGMLQVLATSNTKTVSNFVADSVPAPAAPAKVNGMSIDSFDDGSFGVKL